MLYNSNRKIFEIFFVIIMQKHRRYRKCQRIFLMILSKKQATKIVTESCAMLLFLFYNASHGKICQLFCEDILYTTMCLLYILVYLLSVCFFIKRNF